MNWIKFVKVVLYCQAAVATFLATGMITGKIPPADSEPVNGRKVAAFAAAFAVSLLIIAGQVKRDIRWILIPIAVTGINLLDTLFEFGIRGDHSTFIVPMIIEPVLFLCYLIGYYKLSGRAGTIRQ
jgi:hypothetical protein